MAASGPSAAGGVLGFAGGVQQPPFLVLPPQEGGALSKAVFTLPKKQVLGWLGLRLWQ